MYALVATGRWASLVPHTWGHAFRTVTGLRTMPIDGAPSSSCVGLVIAASQPGSVLARALVDIARRLRLDQQLDQGPPNVMFSLEANTPVSLGIGRES